MSEYTPSTEQVREAAYEHGSTGVTYEEFDRWIAAHDGKVRAETVGYVAQIASDTLRMCQAGGVGERNILPPEQEAGFQLCIDNIANLAKSMKGEPS